MGSQVLARCALYLFGVTSWPCVASQLREHILHQLIMFRVDGDAGPAFQPHSRVSTSHGRISHEDTLPQQMAPSRGSTRSGSGLSGSGRTQESYMSRASTLLNDDTGSVVARGRSGRIQVPDVMLGSTDSFDVTSMGGGAATARSERHLQRELSDLKQQFQFAAVQHREDVNIMRTKLMEMQHQLSQAVAARDEAFEAIVNERAVASLRVQESEAAHRDAAKAAQQLRDKLQLEEHRCRDLMRALDAAQNDVEDQKQRLKCMEQQQLLNLQKLQQHDQQQLEAKHRAIAAEEAHQQLQQQLQHQHQQHQQQVESLQSQLQQQLRAAQIEASSAQMSLIDSERHRSNAEARANRSAAFNIVYAV